MKILLGFLILVVALVVGASVRGVWVALFYFTMNRRAYFIYMVLLVFVILTALVFGYYVFDVITSLL